MKFRPHRGSLDDAMAEMVELPDRAALVALLHADLRRWPTLDHLSAENLTVEPYGSDGDPRVGWKQLFIVHLDGYGVLGFTDGPAT